tara:strand:+ start:149 stop:1246 length:1098 start_codon:yes stop_codon:yes gene_type:complete
MKIVVLGAGNGGCITALRFGWETRKVHGIEVELIYNPEIPAEKVGQGTFPSVPALLDNTLGFNWYNNRIHATPKSGIMYEGWGKVNEKCFHSFPPNSMAMHYCPSDLQNAILKSGHFKVSEGDVPDPQEVDADYVFDCRGTPKDFTEYNTLINPINSVILAKPNWDTTTTFWTRSVTTPNGWAFIIPTQTSSNAVGYLYNKDITSKEDAEKNLLEMFDVEVTRHLNFRNYVAKNPIIDGRIFLNGNRLFFLEPLEANAIQAYMEVNFFIFKQIISKEKTSQETSDRILRMIEEIQNFILWHYYFGSKYDTSFWSYASNLSFKDPNFNLILKEIKRGDDVIHSNKLYGLWHPSSVDNWYRGMNLTS